MKYDINSELLAYFIGFIQSDGTITECTRNRGRISIEISASDHRLIEQMQKEFDKLGITATIHYRTRDTQFKDDYESVLLYVFDLEFRQFISKYVPSGKKSDKAEFIKDIKDEYIKHYVRGLIDGDGSVSITSDGLPFISFWTISQSLAEGIEKYFFNLCGKHRSLNRTKRDNGISLMYKCEEAQIIANELYEKSSIRLDRKYASYLRLLEWERPLNMKKVNRQAWTADQDNFIMNHSISESVTVLNRTEKSIKSRLFRLTH